MTTRRVGQTTQGQSDELAGGEISWIICANASTFFKIWGWIDGSWDSNFRQWVLNSNWPITESAHHVQSAVTFNQSILTCGKNHEAPDVNSKHASWSLSDNFKYSAQV